MKVDAAALMALYSLATAFRLLPLLTSTLPYSVDGFSLDRIASQIIAAGHWSIDPTSPNGYNEALPGFSIVWASVSALGGISPVLMVQSLLPWVTAAAVLPGYLLGLKLARTRIPAIGAGLFLALFGSFLALTSGTAKEALAILVFPMAVLLFAERSDPRKRGLAVALFLVLPLLHHLTTLLALGSASALVLLDAHRALVLGRFSTRRLLVDVVTGPLLAVVAYAYYIAVGLSLMAILFAPDAMALFLSLVVILAILLAPTWKPASGRRGAPSLRPMNRILLVPILGFGLLTIDARFGLFPGTVGIRPALLPIALAALGIVGFAYVGWQLARRTTNRANDVLLAFLVAPTALVLFGFLRGLDPESLVIIYRSIDFVDFALAVLVGAGLAFVWSRLRTIRPARIALGAGFVGLLLLTTPMATDSQAVFGVSNVTRPAEFQALAFLAALHPANVTTDERIADVLSFWFGLSANASLPIVLRANGSVSPFRYGVVEDSWSTIGAQIHPAPNVLVPTSTIATFLASNRVLFVGGDPGNRIFVVQILSG